MSKLKTDFSSERGCNKQWLLEDQEQLTNGTFASLGSPDVLRAKFPEICLHKAKPLCRIEITMPTELRGGKTIFGD